jgi:hypothetical protein
MRSNFYAVNKGLIMEEFNKQELDLLLMALSMMRELYDNNMSYLLEEKLRSLLIIRDRIDND